MRIELQAHINTLDKKTPIVFDVDGVLFKSLDDNGDYLWSKNIKKDLGLSGENDFF